MHRPAMTICFASTMLSANAAAYSTDTELSDPCHERLTLNALERVRARLPMEDRVEPTSEEQALIDDAPFDVPRELSDLGAVSLVLGNRDVDLRGNETDDLDLISQIAADPDRQSEHCLRSPSQDEPDGSRLAIRECRAFIFQQVQSALDGVTEDGVDASERIEVKVVLDLRGPVDADLPRFHIEMGRALHALQDSFSHSYRTDDGRRIVTVLNYVDLVEERLDEARDGPPHSSPLDACVDLDALRTERFELATRASEELLLASLEPDLDRAQREAAAEKVLDRYLELESDCSAENDWCDAPERNYEEERGCVCSLGHTGRAASAQRFTILFAAAALLWRRGMRRRLE